MKNRGFYQQVLGLQSPWKVEQVELDLAAQRVVVHVGVKPGTKWGDPETRGAAHVRPWRQRTWRHLDTCQFETVISAQVPSVKYADGRVEEEAVPWAERYQRVTRLMAQAVMVWLQVCGSVSQVAKVMRLNWHTVNAIMKAAVERGLERRQREPIQYLGLDEKSFRRGHVYAIMPIVFDSGRIWDLVEGRKEEQARKLLQKLETTQRAGVKAVAMDIWSAYRNAVENLLPKRTSSIISSISALISTKRSTQCARPSIGSWPPRAEKPSRAANTFGGVTFPISACNFLSANSTA